MSDLIGKVIEERYRVDAFVGKGGMAEVYKVWDWKRSVNLAMKILHADLAEDKVFLRRFRREAQTLSELQHPNIVRFYNLEQADGLVFILMDYVEGTTLRKEIFESEGPLSQKRVMDVMHPVCAALHYAHQSGFVHCDVKPANIMLNRSGTVFVSDFGISRMTEAATMTMVGAGTPAYMSPEQIRGENPTPQMDIYALGVIMFEMVTGGERPFTGENARTTGSTSEKIRWEQIKLTPPSPRKYNPAISPALEAVVLKSLEKEPTRRYESTLTFLIALETSIVQEGNKTSSMPVADARPASIAPPVGAGSAAAPLTQPEESIVPNRKGISIARILSGLVTQPRRLRGWAIGSLIALLAILALIGAWSQYDRVQKAIQTALAAGANVAHSTQNVTEAGLPYHSDAMGLSLQYPRGWVYKEVPYGSPITLFGSSEFSLASTMYSVLNALVTSKGFIPQEVAVLITRIPVTATTFPASVDPSSAASIRDFFAGSDVGGMKIQVLETSYPYVDGHEAADGTYLISDANGEKKADIYLSVTVWNDAATLFVGASPDDEWLTNKVLFSQIENSLSLSSLASPTGNPAISVGTIKIVSSLPMTGSSLTQTQTIVNAEQLRLAQANNQACGGKYKISYEAWDDASAAQGQWDPAVETENGNKAAADPTIIGYLGTFNSGAAKRSIPILDKAGPLVMISPANTYPGLTKPGYAQGEPGVYYPTGIRNYTRVVTADNIQGKVDATFMSQQLGVKTVYILDDQQLYGKGVADVFEKTAKGLGITVLGHKGIDIKAADYKALMTKISTSNRGKAPDAIFVGMVIDSNVTQLLKDKVSIMGDNTKVKFMGPDGIQTQAMIDGAGASVAEGIYASVVGLPFDKLNAAGKKFLTDYEAKYGMLTEPYAVYGYESMNVALAAIESVCASGGDPTSRKAVRDAVFATEDFNGVLGTWSFDANGDTSLTDMTIYKVENGIYKVVGSFQ